MPSTETVPETTTQAPPEPFRGDPDRDDRLLDIRANAGEWYFVGFYGSQVAQELAGWRSYVVASKWPAFEFEAENGGVWGRFVGTRHGIVTKRLNLKRNNCPLGISIAHRVCGYLRIHGPSTLPAIAEGLRLGIDVIQSQLQNALRGKIERTALVRNDRTGRTVGVWRLR